jgi:hypothetical protein
VVNGCECDLCTNLVEEIFEHVAIKVFGVIDRDLLWDAITTYDILPKELFDGCRGYVVTGFTSTHFVKYSTATMAKL